MHHLCWMYKKAGQNKVKWGTKCERFWREICDLVMVWTILPLSGLIKLEASKHSSFIDAAGTSPNHKKLPRPDVRLSERWRSYCHHSYCCHTAKIKITTACQIAKRNVFISSVIDSWRNDAVEIIFVEISDSLFTEVQVRTKGKSRLYDTWYSHNFVNQFDENKIYYHLN